MKERSGKDRRKRKIDPSPLFWAVILAFALGLIFGSSIVRFIMQASL